MWQTCLTLLAGSRIQATTGAAAHSDSFEPHDDPREPPARSPSRTRSPLEELAVLTAIQDANTTSRRLNVSHGCSALGARFRHGFVRIHRSEWRPVRRGLAENFAIEPGRLLPPQTDDSATAQFRSRELARPRTPLTRTRCTHSPRRAASRGCDAATPGLGGCRDRRRGLVSAAVAAYLVPVGRRSSRRAGVPLLRSRFASTGRRERVLPPNARDAARRTARWTCVRRTGQPRATARHLNGQWEWGDRANRTRIGVRISKLARILRIPVRNSGNCLYGRIHKECTWNTGIQMLFSLFYTRFRFAMQAIRAIRHPPKV